MKYIDGIQALQIIASGGAVEYERSRGEWVSCNGLRISDFYNTFTRFRVSV